MDLHEARSMHTAHSARTPIQLLKLLTDKLSYTWLLSNSHNSHKNPNNLPAIMAGRGMPHGALGGARGVYV